MSWRSSLSMKPSLFWSIILKASLNSWIWAWSNMANTFDVARWALFFVVFPFVLRLDMMAGCVYTRTRTYNTYTFESYRDTVHISKVKLLTREKRYDL